MGANTIATAIASGQCLSVQALGTALGAGTKCGACRPELATLLRTHHPLTQAAE